MSETTRGPAVLDLYPLSPMQQGMLFHALYAPDSGVYVEQRWCVLHGALDPAAFKAAWQDVVDRHSVLRTEFHWEELEQPVQLVYDTAALPWTEDDWQGVDEGEQAARFTAYVEAERRRGFALDRAPLMRCALFKLGPARHRFVWTYHHLLMDGWCNGVLIGEVLAGYAARTRRTAASLPAPRPYRDYIDWLATRDAAADAAYWRQTLGDFAEPTPLPFGVAETGARESDGYGNYYDEGQATLSREDSARLLAFARGAHLTLNTLCQGAWALLLSRYSGRDDVLFGATIAGRPPSLDGVASRIGLFINTVPVRVRTAPCSALLPWLQTLQSAQRAREEHGHAPLLDLHALTRVPRGTALFDSLLVFENYPVSIEHALGGLDDALSIADGGGYERTNFPLTLVVIPGETLSLVARHDSARLPAPAVQRLLAHFLQCLRGFCLQPAWLDEVEILPAAESAFLLVAGAGRHRETALATVPALFAAQAAQRPAQTALVFQDEGDAAPLALSYRNLERRANGLAHRIVERVGDERGRRVGVFVERSPELVVALLGVLKAGAAYVPLEPGFPAERLRYMAKDAALDLLLATDVAAARAVFGETAQLLDARELREAEAPPPCAPTAADLAYLIYTSGSTGLPKGVAIRHGSLSNFLGAMRETPGLAAGESLLAVTTVSFDIAALEIFLPLVTGARLVLVAAGLARDGRALGRQLEAQAVDVMQATPSTWRLLLADGWQGRAGLRMFCGGEALDPALARRLLPLGAALWNLYGPTETTIWSGALRLDATLLDGAQVPIGGPIDNTEFLVLDAALRQAPIGVPGDLYLGGAGLSPGYWRQASLSAQRFVPRPALPPRAWHQDETSDTAIYATGDRARVREDGLLEFLGRLDDQIKLRGHRIELGEIESALNAHPLVAQAAAALREDAAGEPQLVAYLLPRDPTLVAAELATRLRRDLPARLPAYMLPTHYQLVAELPQTLNGKLDRRALPPLTAPTASDTALAVAATPVEEIARGIWREVLHCGAVGAQDDFFALGGHSLAATRIVSRVRQTLDLDLSLRELFDAPRFADFVAALTRLVGTETPALSIPVLPRDGGALPVSHAQRRLWLLAGLVPDSALYAIPLAIRLRGRLDLVALRSALNEIVARHEGLRSAFIERDGEPAVLIAATVPVDLELTDLSPLAPTARERALEELLHRAAGEVFDPGRAPLWRARLVRLAADEHVLALSLHHLLADGWSMGLLLRELRERYRAALAGNDAQNALPTLPVQYADYAAWQRAQPVAEALAFWRDTLAHAPLRTELATDFPRPAEQRFDGARVRFRVESETLARLRRLSREEGVTLFMSLFVAFGVLVGRHGGERDLVIGTPIADRPHPDLEGLIGLFVNTLALRLDLSGDPRFVELLAQVRRRTLAAYQHRHAPFELVLDALDLPRSRSHSPLFQIMFSLQPAAADDTADEALAEDLRWSPLPLENATAKFDLALDLREEDGGLSGSIDYRTDLFRAERVRRLARQYVHLLDGLPEALEQRLSALEVQDAEECAQLRAWQGASQTQAAPQDLIHEYFSAQAAASPSTLAVVQGAARWTYGELEAQSERLAQCLRRRGIGDEALVGVWAERRRESVLAMLAILKAGGVYVPLDPGLPASRLEWLAADAGLVCVLRAEAAPADAPALPWLALDALAGEPVVVEDTPPRLRGGADRLAYVMYTSGSTGLPKGVCTPHRGVTRLVRDNDYAQFGPQEVLLQAAPLGFDASTFEIWGALLNGGRLVLAPASPSLEELATSIEQEGITSLWLTAGLFHLMVDEHAERLRGLRQLLAGGDVLSFPHLRKAHAVLAHTRLINGYGPTEGTTFTCCHTFDAADLAPDVPSLAPPIGRPIAHTRIHVLDADLQPVAIGVPGELYLGGRGLARAYLKQPALTAERFVPNPFVDVHAAALGDEDLTLYRTGDRVRFREDGALEFLGRFDAQVKVRGYRIEPGEIEAALLEHPGVQEACVIALGAAAEDKRLVAYVVPSAKSPAASELRQYLLARLPIQLVPAAFECVDALPLGANGKVDRQALPAPRWEDAAAADAMRAPSALEQTLIEIWSAVLPAGRAAPDSNFFELGGDSIMAMQIVSRAARAGLRLTPKQIFQQQSLAELARVAEPLPSTDEAEETPVPTGPVPLTPIQHWFFEQALAAPAHFNQALCLRVPMRLEHEPLTAALEETFAAHEAFRLRFEHTAAGWRQSHATADEQVASSSIEWWDLRDVAGAAREALVKQRAQALQAGLDLARGPLLRVACMDEGEAGLCLLFVAHHLIVDGVSWRILLEDLQHAYAARAGGLSPQRPLRTASFARWAQALAKAAPRARAELPYWQALLAGTPSALPLDGEAQQPLVARAASHHQVCIVESDGAGDGRSQLSLLLAALAGALAQWTGRDALLIDIEAHGRDAGALGVELDVSRSVGWFTVLHPLRLPLAARDSSAAQLAAVERALREVPGGGFGYGLLRYLDGRAELAADIALGFNYLGRLDAGLAGAAAFERLPAPGATQDPRNARAHLIDVACWSEAGRLHVEWTYDRALHAAATVESLAEEFAAHLRALLARPAAVAPSYVPDDFDLVAFDQSALDAVLAQVSFEAHAGPENK